MKYHGFLALLLLGVLGGIEVSAQEQESEISNDGRIPDLKQKVKELEARLSSLEKRESADMESKEELSRKMQELEKGAIEILEKMSGVEKRCMESTEKFLESLQIAENRFLKVDNHLLMETKQVQNKLSKVIEMVNSVEEEVTSTRKSDQMKADLLQAEVLETKSMFYSFQASQQETKDAVSSSTEELRAYIDGGLSGMENILSNLTARIRTFDNSLSRLEKSCNSCVSKLQGNFDKTASQTTESELLPSGTLGKKDRIQENKKPSSDLAGTEAESQKNQDFFDATFVLECTPLAPGDFHCYSDENSDKMTFSRALDTGRGGSLSKNSSVRVERNKYTFSFTDYDYPERFGAFQCELNAGQHNYMKIITLIQRSKYIADMVSLDPFRVTNVGDSLQLTVELWRQINRPIKWKHNGVDVPSWEGQLQVEIQNVQPTDAGIYECFYEGRRNESSHALMRLIVRNCKENRYGTDCDQECPPCYNGGICHDLLGICVCPAGFTGANCEVPCHGTHFGVNCSERCYSIKCGFRYFCKPDPYGCSCAAGYTGFDCREECEPGFYGAGCKQLCHCANGPESCNGYTGACTGGCSPGWRGLSCQIEVSDAGR